MGNVAKLLLGNDWTMIGPGDPMDPESSWLESFYFLCRQSLA